MHAYRAGTAQRLSIKSRNRRLTRRDEIDIGQALGARRCGPSDPAALCTLQRLAGNAAVAGLAATSSRVSQRHELSATSPLVVQRHFTGLAKTKRSAAFAKTAKTLYDDWFKNVLKTGEQRAGRFKVAVNQALAKEDVPPVDIEINDTTTRLILGDQESGGAAFRPLLWDIAMNENDLESKDDRGDRKPPKERDVVELAERVYHEGRHAEQHFRVARWLASRGEPENSIVKVLSVPNRVAGEAGKQKKLSKKKSTEAASWADSIASSGEIGRDVELKKKRLLQARTLFRQWEKYADTNRDDQTQASLRQAAQWYKETFKEFESIYLEYESITVEEDAWATGGRIAELWPLPYKSAPGFTPHTPQDTDEVLNMLRAEIGTLPT